MSRSARIAMLAVALVSCAPPSIAFEWRLAFDGATPLGARPIGAARGVDAARPHVELAGPSLGTLGGLWTDAVVDPTAGRVVVNAELSLALDEGAAAPTGGVQLLLLPIGAGEVFASDAASLGAPTGAPGAWLGVAFDLTGDGVEDPAGQHIEVNGADPAVSASLATTSAVPDLVGSAAAERTVRLTVVLEPERVEVIATSDGDCFGTRRVLSSVETPLLEGPHRLVVIATRGERALAHRLHALSIEAREPEPAFIRGDCNQDGQVCGSVTDIIRIVVRCFQGGDPFPCEDACDANDDGRVCGSVTDVVYLANHCFGGATSPPPPPWDACGVDPTVDTLDCAEPARCGATVARAFIPLGRNDRGYDELLRTRDDMALILLPPGRFEQGDHFRDFGGDELPVHPVEISRPFLLGKHEVTNAQYRRFLDAIGCEGLDDTDYDHRWDFTGPSAELYDGSHWPEGTGRFEWSRNESYFEAPDQADHPVLWIDWFDAVAYGRWASGTTSTDWSDPRSYGLPSESEWEYAARWRGDGALPSRYPWGGSEGSHQSPENINGELCNFDDLIGRTVPVCSYPSGRSAFGTFNQSGNVYEWTADWYDGDFYLTSGVLDPFVPEGDTFRQLRGGGWFGVPFSVRGAYRCNWRPQDPDVDVGFRCADTAPVR